MVLKSMEYKIKMNIKNDDVQIEDDTIIIK